MGGDKIEELKIYVSRHWEDKSIVSLNFSNLLKLDLQGDTEYMDFSQLKTLKELKYSNSYECDPSQQCNMAEQIPQFEQLESLTVDLNLDDCRILFIGMFPLFDSIYVGDL
eukprot:TRINITY_DN2424_c0_g1_i6.p2 TRINITY_DN2424_c0_g1~~TRINITY_DN2424_c0_g1_i6.p2  ORF type:complete len:111 (-),score=19.63 TRINITY_DN2424_c0_g1_i6:352-684(-)